MAHTVIWIKPTKVKKATGRHWVISVKPSQEPSWKRKSRDVTTNATGVQQQHNNKTSVTKNWVSQKQG